MIELIQISFSAWSESARWALDHHQVQYKRTEYVPFVQEPMLRIRLRRPFGRVSVPVLFDNGRLVDGSYEIARFAEANGKGVPLFFDEPACKKWDELAQAAMAYGRARTSWATVHDVEAQVEALPPQIPKALRSKAAPLAARGARMFITKYGEGDHLQMEQLLSEAQKALNGGNGTYLLGDRFSYADITVANALAFVSPYEGKGTSHPLPRRFKKGPATKRVWTDAELAEKYSNIVTWRDELFASHRFV